MTATFAPIQTTYRGYRFRSRLEARWAVFFDALGLKYEYEPEGFEMPGTGCYLPDFRLDSVLWVEVKPSLPSEEEMRKAEALAEGSSLPVVIGIGEPGFGDLLLYCWDLTESGGGSGWWDHCWFGASDVLHVVVPSERVDRNFCGGHWESSPYIVGGAGSPRRMPRIIERAANKARAARFEHGETPR